MLTDVQLYLIGIVAMLVVWLVKLAKADLNSGWLTTGVYVVALVLAYFFNPLAIPTPPVCSEAASCASLWVQWLSDLLVPLSAFVGFATLIYNTLWKNIIEAPVKSLFARFKPSK